jgi:hypothetical protein
MALLIHCCCLWCCFVVTIIGFCGHPCPCEPTPPEWHCCITKPLSWRTKKFEVLWRNLEETLKELQRNFERNFEVHFEVLQRNFFTFFCSLEFLCSTLLIEEFQIYVVVHSNIRTYSIFSNFPTAPLWRPDSPPIFEPSLHSINHQ